MCLAIALSIQDSVAPQSGATELQDDQCAGLTTTTNNTNTTLTATTAGAGASPMFLSRSSSAVVPDLQTRCCSEHLLRSYGSPVFVTGAGVGGPSRLSCNCSSNVCSHTLPCIGQEPTSRRLFCRCGMCSADADSCDCGFHQHVFSRPRLSFTGGDAAAASSDSPVTEMVFEPRPPHPYMLTSTKKSSCADRCGLAHDETVTVLDPWRRRPLSLDHQHAKPHCIRSAVCCGSTKHGGVSKRRRSCGTHTSRHHDHFATLETGYASDRALSPALSATDVVLSSKDLTSEDGSFRILPPSASNPAKTKQDSIDLIISSDILESMLQGTAGYRVGLMSQERRSEWTSDGHLASVQDTMERPVKIDAEDESAAAAAASSSSATVSTTPVAVDEADQQPDDGDAVFV